MLSTEHESIYTISSNNIEYIINNNSYFIICKLLGVHNNN